MPHLCSQKHGACKSPCSRQSPNALPVLPSQLGNPGSPPAVSAPPPSVLSEFVLTTGGLEKGKTHCSWSLEPLSSPKQLSKTPPTTQNQQPRAPRDTGAASSGQGACSVRRLPYSRGGTARCSSAAQAQASSIFKHEVRKPVAKAAFRPRSDRCRTKGCSSRTQKRGPARGLALPPLLPGLGARSCP